MNRITDEDFTESNKSSEDEKIELSGNDFWSFYFSSDYFRLHSSYKVSPIDMYKEIDISKANKISL